MNDLTDLLERTTGDLRPDVTRLVSGGMGRGRRLRRRRRIGTAAGALAGVAVVGGAALMVPAQTGAGEPGAPVLTRPAASTTAGSLLPSRASLAGGHVVALPAGSTLIKSWGSEQQGFVAASWKVTPADGRGSGRIVIRIDLQDAWAKPAGATASVDEACRTEPGSCTREADGSWTSRFVVTERKSGGAQIISANGARWTRSGLHITATAYSATSEEHTDATRAKQILDAEQLQEMVRAADLG